MRVMGSASVVALVCLSACSTTPIPDGVQRDVVHYARTVFAEAPGMNLVSDLGAADFDRDGQLEIRAISADGVRLFDVDGHQKRFTAFDAPEPPWATVGLTTDPRQPQAYVGNLPTRHQTVLFDETGHVQWQRPGQPFDQPAVGDVDADGRNEIVVKSARGSLEVVHADGRVSRDLGASMRPLFYSVADMDGDGKADVIAENASGSSSYPINEISIVAGDGRPLHRWNAPHRFYRFFVARLRHRATPVVMFHSDDTEELVFVDAAGAVVKRLEAKWGNRLAIPIGHAMTVEGRDDGFVCLASGRGGDHRHVVYVYGGSESSDTNNALVYLDSEADDALSLLVVEQPQAGDASFFLVGGRNVIWKYAPTAK